MKLTIMKRIKHLLEAGEGLHQRTVRSGIWAFALRITERGFSLIVIIILARVLAPNDFGLMGIALLAMLTLETFSQAGFEQALIQKKENVPDYLNVAWTALVLRSLVVCVILFFTAPYIAIFFNTTAATPIIKVIGIASLLQGFTNIGVIYFRKELEFNKQFFYWMSGTLASVIVTITAVLILRSVWALVFGLLAANVVRFTASYLIHPYRPHFSWDLGRAKELFGFGKWILGSSILIFLLTQGDDIFVGKFLGVTLLGFYQMAYKLSNTPATEITHVLHQVTFPAYAKLQDNLPGLRKAYLKTLQFTAFISIPLAGGIFILAPEFTSIFLGDKWMPMVPAMQVLALCGLIRSITATTGSIFQGVGKPGIATKLQFARLILMVIIIYPLTIKWGILGTSLTVLLSMLFTMPTSFYLTKKMIQCRVWEYGKLVTLPLLGTLVMCGTLLAFKYLVFGTVGVFSFFVLIAIGVIIYAGMAILFIRLFSDNIKTSIQESLGVLFRFRL
jgi:lipopolysaccharide exporter